MRKTLHSKMGEKDAHYTYVIIRRGTRPQPKTMGNGLVGPVAREAEARALAKAQSMEQGLIVPIKGQQNGEIEVMRYVPPTRRADADDSTASPNGQDPTVMTEESKDDMRKEAYYWPRLIFPPKKRSGHVIMDTCHPSGELFLAMCVLFHRLFKLIIVISITGQLVRMTIPRSQSKQAYYDARKVTWGDMFPFEPKGREIVRDRGMMKPNKADQAAKAEALADATILGSEAGMDAAKEPESESGDAALHQEPDVDQPQGMTTQDADDEFTEGEGEFGHHFSWDSDNLMDSAPQGFQRPSDSELDALIADAKLKTGFVMPALPLVEDLELKHDEDGDPIWPGMPNDPDFDKPEKD